MADMVIGLSVSGQAKTFCAFPGMRFWVNAEV